MALNEGYTYGEQIGRCDAGATVLAYLARKYPHSSEAEWRERIDKERVLLGGIPVQPHAVLQAGQQLVWLRPAWDEPDVPLCYAILYRDEDLLAVAKPNGLPSVPAGGFMNHTLLTIVRRHYPEATPVHRLGRGTSGVVLFARSKQARRSLTASLRTGEMGKVYRTLVVGHPQRDSFVIDVPIGPVPHPVLGTLHVANVTGKAALSEVRVLERFREDSLLEVRITTGRPHQIRIHLAAAGHPLKGDPLYALGGHFKKEGLALPGDTGYFLHAHRMSFPHPATGTFLNVHCFPPPELRTAGERRT